jgi:predicted MPP superfamily phosphohydrolase
MYKVLTGELKIETITVAIDNLPQNLQGIKIVQLSDFHYEDHALSQKMLTEAISLTNQAQPDVIVCTGDYITKKIESIYNLVSELKNLESRLGIYAILGNHDIAQPQSREEIAGVLNSIGISVLWNEVCYPFDGNLAFVGMAELQSGEFKPESILKTIPSNIPRIVLSHNPDTFLAMRNFRVDLQLSGHTHGSQIVFPKIGHLPGLLKIINHFIPNKMRRRIPYISDYFTVVKHWEWYQGLHQIGNNKLYVSRGLGTFFPGRLFCPPEVTLIILIRQQ